MASPDAPGDGRAEEGRTYPINMIPPPSQTEHPRYSSVNAFVGSPDEIPSNWTAHRSTSHLPISNLGQLTNHARTAQHRPIFTRSVSTPHGASNTQHSPSIRDFRRTFLRDAGRDQGRHQEREWTIFEDMMSGDRERHLQVPSYVGGTLGRWHGPTPSTASATPLPSPVQPQLQPLSGETVQSPVQERQFLSPRTTQEFPASDTVSERFVYQAAQEEEEEEEAGPPPIPPEQRAQWLSFLSVRALPKLTPLQRNILKCSIAYFIASLFTFSPYLSSLISDITNGPGENAPFASAHMVATITVYFNPAKTVGAMLEADTFCFMGLLYSTFISLGSMGMFWYFEVRHGWEWLANLLVLLWLGIGMAAVAWMKVWMGKPSFNTACSMTAIFVFIVVVKEGGLTILSQVALIVFWGSLISNLVCNILWRQHATKNLQETMIRTLDSFSTLLTMITQTFLLEEPVRQPSKEKIQKAVDSHQASFTALKKNLAEARSERWFGGPGKPSPTRPTTNSGQAYEDAVDSLNRLGQHLNGLRSGTELQFELIEAKKEGKLITLKNSRPPTYHPSNASISESISASTVRSRGKTRSANGQSEEDLALLQAAADAFGDMFTDLDSPLKALSSTCSTTLRRLREAFAAPHKAAKKDAVGPEFDELTSSLERALYQFESTANHAIMRLYRRTPDDTSGGSINSGLDGDNPYTTGTNSENIFLIYFFIFTLEEFAKELASLIEAMGRICKIQRQQAEQRKWWTPFIQPLTYLGKTIASRPRGRRPPEKKKTMRKRLSSIFTPGRKLEAVTFPKVKPHAPNTVQTPGPGNLSYWGRFKQSLWLLGARLQEPDMKYAFKTGMALAILAAPAFFETTRPIFTEFRGEWALISFFVVMSPTIGATNFLALHRVLGTALGAATAVGIWTLFPENPYALSIFGFFYSLPCFYYIVATPKYATSARFVLLTYNLTCLYCYNIRGKDVPIFDIAYHRFVAVAAGVIWASIVSRYWWPTEARRELGKALGDFCLNIGWLYTRLVAFNSLEHDNVLSQINEDDDTMDERASLLARSKNDHLNESIIQFMAMELHLQIKLIELQTLLNHAQHEPRLKGPFPVQLYRSILTSLQAILDKLHSMRCVTIREEWHSTVVQDYILPVNKERRDMVGNIILYFSTLASAFRLKSPLPPYLPPAEEARERLVQAIRRLDIIKNRDVKGSRHLLFFAYAITMRGVIHELDYLGRTVQEAFGVIGGSREAFESLFRDEARLVV